jgi:hypothetical protein
LYEQLTWLRHPPLPKNIAMRSMIPIAGGERLIRCLLKAAGGRRIEGV